MADIKVKEAADRVRSTLVQEIIAFNQASVESGASNDSGFEHDQDASKFSVNNPIKMSDTAGLKIGSVIKYTVEGQDSTGRFEVQRRYNEFLMLNKSLNESWPGCYIPAIPEKQFIGDKDENFVEERR